jgi:hypothetical protein
MTSLLTSLFLYSYSPFLLRLKVFHSGVLVVEMVVQIGEKVVQIGEMVVNIMVVGVQI